MKFYTLFNFYANRLSKKKDIGVEIRLLRVEKNACQSEIEIQTFFLVCNALDNLRTTMKL